MPVSADFHRFVVEQLAGLGSVASRSMFGGIGLYHEGLFFGLIDDDTLYLKVDGTNRDAYVSRGMKPFCPYPDKPEYQMGGYYQVPVEVLEDGSQLEVWARQSRQVALTAQARKAKDAGSKAKVAAKRKASRAGAKKSQGKPGKGTRAKPKASRPTRSSARRARSRRGRSSGR